ncbi:MAG: quinone-dependent dihydroorotate dehydrogenase [Bacteroidetes bacterium]|jgi:dihydroorotate dehydrogenase|nr:quinone-dependent dihydroorotate dehydrogenase [Bacteroidota bacterium]
MYKLFIRPLFFLSDPEKAHYFTFTLLKLLHKIPGFSWFIQQLFTVNHPKLERKVFGITFKNPVGLAAGFDKNADLYNELSDFGFSFIEVGTVTPKPQEGNPKKRVFRLVSDEAIINRMGFNNIGVDHLVNNLKSEKRVIIGGNIGKNKDTSNETANSDYVICFEALYDYVDYFTVNVSSPNTPGLRSLQDKEPLKLLLSELQQLNKSKKAPKPILLKIAPDLTNEQLLDIIEIINETKLDGVIATNSSIHLRDDLKASDDKKNLVGGISGKPLKERSTEVIKFLADKSNKSFAIIGVGGIHSAADAMEKLNAGADLIQIYTGFIYEGPALIKEINNYLIKN